MRVMVTGVGDGIDKLITGVYQYFWHLVLWAEKWWGTKWRLFLQIRGSKVKWNETSIYYKLRGLKGVWTILKSSKGSTPFHWLSAGLKKFTGAATSNWLCEEAYSLATFFSRLLSAQKWRGIRAILPISLTCLLLISPLHYMQYKNL